MMELQIKCLSEQIGTVFPMPSYATDGAAGLDLCACIQAPITLPSGGRAMVPTGVAVAIPDGQVGLLFARSSMGVKCGVSLSNGVGVIDSDYRGEINAALTNHSNAAYTVQPGDRVAQLVLLPVTQMSLAVVDALPETARGAGGFGSTGR